MGTQTADELIELMKSRGLDPRQQIQVDKELLEYKGMLPAMGVPGKDLQLFNIRSQGRGLPLLAGRRFPGGSPIVMSMENYIRQVVPGEPSIGDYVKETAASAFGSFMNEYGSAAQNILEIVLPEGAEQALGVGDLAENVSIGSRAAVPPSQDVAAHGGMAGKFISQDLGGAAGSIGAYALPGLGTGRAAALLGAGRAGTMRAAMAGAGALGALSQSQSLYTDVLKETGDEKKAWMAYFAGLGIGATESLDIPVIMGIDRKTRGFIKDILVHGGLESAQETFQQGSEEALYAALTDQERNAMANMFKALTVGGVVGGGARGIGRFGEKFLQLHSGTTGEMIDKLNAPSVPHAERLKTHVPWENLEPSTKSVVDDFLRANENDTNTEQQRDDIRRAVVVPPATEMESFISNHVAQRGGRVVFLSHPGERLSNPSVFDPKTGTVVIDTQAAPQAILSSFWAHETGHLEANTNPEAFFEKMRRLEQDAPGLVQAARERRMDSDPDDAAEWKTDPGLVQNETYGQLSQDLAGLIYLWETDPKFVEQAIQGPGKKSFIGLMDSVIKTMGTVLGKDFATVSERQLMALSEINQAMGGVAINPREAAPIAREIVRRWQDLVGQTYMYTGGLARPGMTESTEQQAGPPAPRSASYETARPSTGQPGKKPITQPITEGSPEGDNIEVGEMGTAAPAEVPPTGGLLEGLEAPEGPLFPYQSARVQAQQDPAAAQQGPEAPIQVTPGTEHGWMLQVLQAYGKVKAEQAKPAKPTQTPPPTQTGTPQPVEGVPQKPLDLPKVSEIEPLLGAEKSEVVSGREATEPSAPSAAPLMSEMDEEEGEAEETGQSKQDQAEFQRLRNKALGGMLSSEEKRRALELYAGTPDGHGNLTTLASNPDLHLAKDIQDDVGFKVSRAAAAAAAHKAKVRPATKPKNYPDVTIDKEDEDYKPVSKLVNAFFSKEKHGAVQGGLSLWRSGGTFRKPAIDILTKATGVPITDAQIQKAFEQIVENKANGIQVPKAPGEKLQFASFNPYTKGDALQADPSTERSALRAASKRANEILFNDFDAMDRNVRGKAKGESSDVSLKQVVFWGRLGDKEDWVRKDVQRRMMETLADAGIHIFTDKEKVPSFDTYLLRKSADKYQAVVDARAKAEPELSEQGKEKVSRAEEAKIKEEAALLAPKDRAQFIEKAYARRKEQLNLKKGSGLSKQEIAEFDRKFAALPRSTQRAFERAGEMVYRMTAEGRKWMVEQGYLTQEESDAWDKLFGKEYVPHLTIYEPDAQFTPIGDGFQVPAKLWERVRGRTTRPYSPTVAVFNQAIQRAIVTERNRVGRSLGELVKAFPDEGMWKHFDNHAEIPEEFVETGKVFRYMDNGRKQWIAFTGPEGKAMADAMRRLNVQNAGMFEILRPLTRFVMNMATSWNVFFSAGNFSRDVLTAVATSGAEIDKHFATSVAKNAPRSLRVAMAAADVPGISDVAAKTISEAEIQDFKKFQAAGGRTGIIELQTYGNRLKRIEAEFKRYAGSTDPLKIRRSLSNTIEALEGFNGAFEQATRYSAWKEAKKRGMSDDVAAKIAKEISVNFNKRGTIAPAIGALYAFSSASLAGLHRFGKVVGTKRGAYLAGGMFFLGFLESLFNRSMAGDDKDGENAWNALNDYEKARYFRLSTGGTEFFGFPMPWGWNLPVYMGVLTEHAISEGMKPSEFIRKLVVEAVENVNPIGGQTLAQAVTPTAGRWATEIGQNIDPFGRPIRPEPTPFDYATPSHEQHFQSVSPMWKEVARQLAMLGGDEIKPGPIDISPEDLEHASSFMVGGALRNAWRFASVGSDLIAGDSTRIGQLPGARYFVSSPSAEGRALRFHEVVKGAEKSKQLVDRAVDTGEPELIEKTVGEEGGMASIADHTKALQKAFSQLRKALNAATDEGEKAEIQEAMDEIQRIARTMKMEVTK